MAEKRGEEGVKWYQQILTRNDCYRAGQTIVPVGVMVHSTGANNPRLSRYVPGSEEIGWNTGGNHWDRSGTGACVHAFLGKMADGSVGVVQTLPWNMRGWHCGDEGNNTHISFEICEDGLEDEDYFRAVYREAVELTAYLCKKYGLDPLADGVVICHQEGARRGIASNHADVLHWFPMHGMTMDDFRADVAQEMEAETVTYEQWLEYLERYRREAAAKKASMPELLAEAVELNLTDGSRPRDLMTREEGAIMARAAAKAR